MPKVSSGVAVSSSCDEFKDELRKHVAKLYEQGFFESEAAHQKALDNIDSITDDDWKKQAEFRREGIDRLN